MTDVRHTYIAISWSDFEKFGCPFCGCSNANSNIRFGNQVPAICTECNIGYTILPDNVEVASFSQGNDKIHAKLINHPRKGLPKHEFKAPDIKPKSGEYWAPRSIGYDLAGFVKCKESGERVVNMFKAILGDKTKTWLDYRPNEPLWIQVKVSAEDADLQTLHELTKDSGIITEEIVNIVIKK